MELTFEEFESIVYDYYKIFSNKGLSKVWEEICFEYDIDEDDEGYDEWFNTIIKDMPDSF